MSSEKLWKPIDYHERDNVGMPHNLKRRKSHQNCCFTLSHISLGWLLILTKNSVALILDILGVPVESYRFL